MNHSGTKEIKTKRLILRKFRQGDAQMMFDNWASDERVAKYTTWDAHKSIEVTQMFLNYIINKYEKNDAYHWGIEFGEKLIGSIDILCSDDNIGVCGIGYCLCYDYWNQRIATEAAKSVINFLFNTVGYRRIIAGHDNKNPASGKVLKKIGMKHEGTLREHILRKDGTYGDDELYGILITEYHTLKSL